MKGVEDEGTHEQTPSSVLAYQMHHSAMFIIIIMVLYGKEHRSDGGRIQSWGLSGKNLHLLSSFIMTISQKLPC